MRQVGGFLMLGVMVLGVCGSGYGEHVIGEKEKPEFLYVLSGKSGSFEEDTLTLKDVPLVVYFSDRPYRIAGHMSLKKFVEQWGKGKNSFKADPPNATLSIFDESGNKNVVLEISEPGVKGEALVFKVRLLQGRPPASFGPASLFVDIVMTGGGPG